METKVKIIDFRVMVDFTLLHLFDKSKQKQAYNPPLPRSSVAAGRSPPPLHVHLN